MLSSEVVNVLRSGQTGDAMTANLTKLEVCVDNAEALALAVQAGADRIELCAALALDGLTPGPGLIAQAAALDLPVVAMIRPRGGDFRFGGADLDTALADIAAIRSAGLSGIVIGATRADGRLDEPAMARMAAAAGGLQVTLHRAFDLSPDPETALEQAIGLGISRILTSGGAARAIDGADRLARLVRAARGRIEIMAGGGVRAADAGPLLATGVNALHGSFSDGGARRLPDPAEIAATRAQIAAARPRRAG